MSKSRNIRVLSLLLGLFYYSNSVSGMREKQNNFGFENGSNGYNSINTQRYFNFENYGVYFNPLKRNYKKNVNSNFDHYYNNNLNVNNNSNNNQQVSYALGNFVKPFIKKNNGINLRNNMNGNNNSNNNQQVSYALGNFRNRFNQQNKIVLNNNQNFNNPNLFIRKKTKDATAPDTYFKGNLVYSPMGFAAALILAGVGGDYKQRQGVAKYLKFKSFEDVGIWFNNFMRSVPKEIKVANSMWLISDQFNEKTQLRLNSKFKDAIRRYFGAESSLVSLNNACANINNWVRNKTGNKINSIIDNLDRGAALVLVNAIYLKLGFENYFKSEDPIIFRGLSREYKIRSISSSKKCGCCYFSNYSVVKIPLESDQFLYLVMPHDSSMLDSISGNLRIKDIIKNWRVDDNLFVRMPMFKIESKLNLLEFCSDNPFLTRLVSNYLTNIASDPRMRIDKMLQRVILTINEKGCEAAAATATGVVQECFIDVPKGRKFLVDKPFLCFITDNSGNELFRAKVTDLGESNSID